MGVFILNLAMTVTTIWSAYKFWGIFLLKRKLNMASMFIWIMFGIQQMMILYHFGMGSIWMAIVTALLFFLISVCGYHRVGKSKIFLALLFCASWILIEMMVFYGLSLAQVEKPEFDVIGVVVSKLMMVIEIYVISAFWKKQEKGLIPLKYYLVLLLFPMGSIYIALDRYYSAGHQSDGIFSMITVSILLLFNILIFELYSKLNKILAYEREKTVYAQQIYRMARYTREQKTMVDEFHMEKHDLINELVVLKSSIENGDQKNVASSLNRIIRNFDVHEAVCNSGNSIVDALINFKFAVAREQGIEFKMKIFIPEELPVDQCDIGIVLGNALDNAMEALHECENQQKAVRIFMGIKKEALIIVIKNPYTHSLRMDKWGNFATTKGEGSRHGYGLSSIKRVAEKYGGEVVIDTEGNVFSLTIIINLGNFDSRPGDFDR